MANLVPDGIELLVKGKGAVDVAHTRSVLFDKGVLHSGEPSVHMWELQRLLINDSKNEVVLVGQRPSERVRARREAVQARALLTGKKRRDEN